MLVIRLVYFAIYLLFLSPVCVWGGQSELNPQIEWRVENPFPFLKYSKDYASLIAGLESIKRSGEFGDYSKAVESVYRNTMWDSSTSSYDRSLVHSDETVIQARLISPGNGDMCAWKGIEQQDSSPCGEWRSVKIRIKEINNLNVDITSESKDKYSLGTTAEVTKKIILGLGDSFSSGEGNPDRQAKWDEAKISKSRASYYQRNWPLYYKPSADEQADWNDVKCHRSLYSWQFLYAINQAENDPHKLVVFISFACSGAEIYDGLLVQQRVTLRNANDTRTKANDSQVNEAVSLLCRVKSNNREYPDRKHLIGNRRLNLIIKECPQEELVKPDEILLTIGGNDVGFGGLIAWSAFPGSGYNPFTTTFVVPKINKQLELKAGMICPERNLPGDYFCRSNEVLDVETPPSRFVANDAFVYNWLKDNINFSHNVLVEHFQIQPDKIVQLTYPSPTKDEKGNTCTFQQGAHPSRALKNELFSPINRIVGWTDFLLEYYYNRYSVGPTHQKLNTLDNGVVNKLRTVIEGENKRGVNIVDVGREFATHGYCSKKSTYELEMPTTENQKAHKWWPPEQAPRLQNAWKVVQRWFRTPNDAQLAMYYDSFYQEKGWQSGMMHPNHLGHFSMFSTLNATYGGFRNTAYSTENE